MAMKWNEIACKSPGLPRACAWGQSAAQRAPALARAGYEA